MKFLVFALAACLVDPGSTLKARKGLDVSPERAAMDPTQHPNWGLLQHQRCGLSAADRIIGGKDAALGAYPWIVRIGYSGVREQKAVFRCGAVLISSMYVLTAAHCVTNLPEGTEVGLLRMGEHDTRTDPDCEGDVCAEPVQDVRPAEVLVHPKYGKPAFRNDIALIRLERNVSLTDYVMPICIIYGELLNKNYVGLPTEVAGWGVYDIQKPRPSSILQTITLQVVSNEGCAEMFEAYATIGPTQMCVGGIVGQDSCGGDSGGPLMRVDAVAGCGPRYYLLGVVSFGSKRCGASTMPGVYTRLADFLIWTLDNMRP